MTLMRRGGGGVKEQGHHGSLVQGRSPRHTPMVGSSGTPMVGSSGTPMVGCSGTPMVGSSGTPKVGSSGTPMVWSRHTQGLVTADEIRSHDNALGTGQD